LADDLPPVGDSSVAVCPSALQGSRAERGSSSIGAFIFDVDGVIADTADLHKAAWRRLAEDEGFAFDDAAADPLRGLSREASLRRLLGPAEVSPERFAELTDRKNRYYLESLSTLTEADVLPGVRALLCGLGDLGIRLAAVSVSRNARSVLLRIDVVDRFDIVIDGSDLARFETDLRVGQRSSLSLPRFLQAARILKVEPGRCVVVEDSTSGIAMARTAGMRSVGIGHPDRLCAATMVFESLRGVDAATLIDWLDRRDKAATPSP
jgi:beta-phosphoglucomutase